MSTYIISDSINMDMNRYICNVYMLQAYMYIADVFIKKPGECQTRVDEYIYIISDSIDMDMKRYMCNVYMLQAYMYMYITYVFTKKPGECQTRVDKYLYNLRWI